MVGGFHGTLLRYIQDLLLDGKTLYERRFGVPFNGPVIPSGAMVENHLISAKDLSRPNQFGPNVLPGICLGYALNAGGIWKGDIVVADMYCYRTTSPITSTTSGTHHPGWIDSGTKKSQKGQAVRVFHSREPYVRQSGSRRSSIRSGENPESRCTEILGEFTNMQYIGAI